MTKKKTSETAKRTADAQAARCQTVSDWMMLADLITACNQALRGSMAARAMGASITEPQFALLWICARIKTGVSQSDLAAGLALSAAHVSGLVERLSARRLIHGQRCPGDRRRQIWQLTDEGRLVVERVVGELLPWCEKLEIPWGSGQRQGLEATLRKLLNSLREPPGYRDLLPIPAAPETPTTPPSAGSTGVDRAQGCAGGAA